MSNSEATPDKRFNVAGTHVGDRKDPDWMPQFRSYKIAKLVADKLNSINDIKNG